METVYTSSVNEFKRMTTEELRETFLLNELYTPGELKTIYWEVDRTVVGGAIPTRSPLRLEGGKELASRFFCERREVGVMNLGAPGRITVDGVRYNLDYTDCLYIGRGTEEIVFESENPSNPSRFHILSYPAHANYPTSLVTREEANPLHLGSDEESNKRTIYQYIHPNGIKSCQLVMGFTVLETGSVWNTMKPHTHERRSEVYTYFDLSENDAVIHLMGKADETRHLVVRNMDTAISPSWSFHSGAGTKNYSFIWGMGGENQRFDDMDHIEVRELK